VEKVLGFVAKASAAALAVSIGAAMFTKTPGIPLTSLGMAAEQLFDSLPKESRKALGDLPALLARLQSDAQRLRKRYDDLQDALADAGDAASSAEYADVCEVRDAIHAQLREAVGALEMIRLNLLRLHAGSVTIEGLTTQI
jgi:hypothetical protein